MSYRKLITGFRAFHADYFGGRDNLFQQLVTEGQSPKVMVIACSDSRIDPAILTQSEPGDIFTVRNVAALVPADTADHSGHGTQAAVEYAVKALKVEHIIILGHALCGGIRALAESTGTPDDSYIASWIGIAAEARDRVRKSMPDATVDEQSRALEKAAILTSLNNLMTYSWVTDAVEAGTLKLHGWYFDIPKGQLLNYNPDANEFQDVLAPETAAASTAPAIAAASVMADECDCAAAPVSLARFINRFKVLNRVKAKLTAATGTTLATLAPETETILTLF